MLSLQLLKKVLGIEDEQLITMTVIANLNGSVELVDKNGVKKILQGDYVVGDEVLVSGSSIFGLKEIENNNIWVE